MADMGFMPQVTALLKQVEQGGQTMLFSATLDRNIDRLVRMFLTDPVVHSVDPSAGAVTTMEHHVLYVADETDKKAVALRIAAREGRVIMFLDTKRAVDRFTKRLLANGVRASGLHGGRSQPQRNRTLDQFKTGQVTALVATNVAARGIHVDDLDLVVNVDPPTDHKDYLHRGGRTARAGESGSVVTLVLPDEKREMTRLMSDAEISPKTARVKSSDEELAGSPGAVSPPGCRWSSRSRSSSSPAAFPAAAAPGQGGSAGQGQRRSRLGQGQSSPGGGGQGSGQGRSVGPVPGPVVPGRWRSGLRSGPGPLVRRWRPRASWWPGRGPRAACAGGGPARLTGGLTRRAGLPRRPRHPPAVRP